MPARHLHGRRVRLVHDAGRSLDPLVDLGQVEGGLVQGIGWMTMEELLFHDGRNLHRHPDHLQGPGHPERPRRSKATSSRTPTTRRRPANPRPSANRR